MRRETNNTKRQSTYSSRQVTFPPRGFSLGLSDPFMPFSSLPSPVLNRNAISPHVPKNPQRSQAKGNKKKHVGKSSSKMPVQSPRITSTRAPSPTYTCPLPPPSSISIPRLMFHFPTFTALDEHSFPQSPREYE